MKIGILVDEIFSGGFQKVAVMEAKHLKKLGHQVTLVVLHRTDKLGYQDIIKENQLEIDFLSDRLPLFLKINFRFPFFAFFSFFHIFYPLFIHRYIKKDEFDVFLTHGTYTAFSSISIAKKTSIPYVCFIHDPISYILPQKYADKVVGKLLWLLMPLARRLDRAIIRNAKAIIAFPDMIIETKKIVPDYPHYHEIFNGCEVVPEDELRMEKDTFIMAATKWDQGKNFELLVEIWKKLSVKIPLKVVGLFARESLKKDYRAMVDEAGLSDRIELVGSVSEAQLNEYYGNAKLLVHPCREAFGMTIIEAAANGCPSVFTSNSGVASLFPDKITKFLPAENDVDGYVERIDSILNLGKKEYDEFAREYHATAKANSWENHCKQVVKLF